MIIDTNISIGRWPFRRLVLDDPERLVEFLLQHEVCQAWTGSLDGLFHRDIAGVNERLADDCQRYGQHVLLPFGTVNPLLPDWMEDLRRCHEDFQMRGIRLHPGYHGYDLAAEECGRLFAMAEERKLIVQLVVSMEDERTQHPRYRVPPVKMDQLPTLIQRYPGLRLIIVNGMRTITLAAAAELRKLGSIWFDIATLEGIEGVARLVEMVSSDRIVFGSHTPLFYFASAELKLQEAGLPEAVLRQIRSRNAQMLLE